MGAKSGAVGARCSSNTTRPPAWHRTSPPTRSPSAGCPVFSATDGGGLSAGAPRRPSKVPPENAIGRSCLQRPRASPTTSSRHRWDVHEHGHDSRFVVSGGGRRLDPLDRPGRVAQAEARFVEHEMVDVAGAGRTTHGARSDPTAQRAHRRVRRRHRRPPRSHRRRPPSPSTARPSRCRVATARRHPTLSPGPTTAAWSRHGAERGGYRRAPPRQRPRCPRRSRGPR